MAWLASRALSLGLILIARVSIDALLFDPLLFDAPAIDAPGHDALLMTVVLRPKREYEGPARRLMLAAEER